MEIVVRSDHSEHATLPAFPPLMDAVRLLCSSRGRIHVRRTVSHRFALIRASPMARSLARRRVRALNALPTVLVQTSVVDDDSLECCVGRGDRQDTVSN